MAEQLPLGSIQPVAQPVSTFIRPVERQVASAAQAPGVPRVGGIEVISQGSGGNVQGGNAQAELAAALVDFNANLRTVVGQGLELYATGEYRKGQNEAARALVLANQQRLASMAEYTAENRRLEAKDPIAAMAMDSINPYRRAGRENALARAAAAEVPSALEQAYRNTPGIEAWRPEDPRIAQLRADATAQLMQRYGLTDNSPGFLDYVTPAVNEAWGRLVERQWADNQESLKKTVPYTLTSELASTYANALSKGVIQVFDARGVPRQIKAGDPDFDSALQSVMQSALDRLPFELGLRGEATAARSAALDDLITAAVARQDTHMLRVVSGLAIGPPDKDGRRPLVGTAKLREIIDAQVKYGDYFEKQRLEKFGNDAAMQLIGVTDPGQRAELMQQLQLDAIKRGVPADKAVNLLGSMTGDLNRIQEFGADTSEVEQRLMQIDAFDRLAPDFSPAQSMQELERNIRGLPQADQTRLRNQLQNTLRRNEQESKVANKALVNQLIDNRIKTNLRANYPRNMTEQALRQSGGDIRGFLAWGNANLSASAERQFSAYQQHVADYLASKAQELKKPRLTDAETIRFTNEALNEYGSRNKKALAYLFPGVNGEPGAPDRSEDAPPPPPPGPNGTGLPDPSIFKDPPGGGGATQSKPKPKPKPKPSPQARTVRAVNLDQADEAAIKAFRSQKVLTIESVNEELLNLYNGGKPPAALKRAARTAGVSPAEFLIKQAERYPALKLPPQMKQKLLKDGRRASAMGNYFQGASAMQQGPVAKAANLLLDMLSSVVAPPAVAATMPTMQARLASRPAGPGPGRGRGPLKVEQLVTLARNSGFSPADAAVMAAIAMAESGGNPRAHNPNRSTGDNSYGLWQINMIDQMGPDRRRAFGIARNEALWDPAMNATAARMVHQWQGFGAWSVYRSGAYRQYLPAAMRALSRS